MKYLFIVNPIAGGKNNRHDAIEAEIKTLMENSEHDYEIYVTKAPLDACKKIKEEAAKGEELWIIACGGDGTLNECVAGAAEFPNCAISSYPCGTGNDFIRMFGHESSRFLKLEDIVNGETVPIDIIKCNDRYSINICSVGLDARVAADVHKYSHLPIIGGSVGYVASLVVNYFKRINDKLRIRIGDEEINGEFALICACNGRYYGGGFNPVPDARVEDGLIDFLIVNKVTRLQILKVIGKYSKGEYYKLPHIVRRISAEKMDIYSENELIINIDGESQYSKFVHWEIIKKGIRFIFPKDMDYFKVEQKKIEV